MVILRHYFKICDLIKSDKWLTQLEKIVNDSHDTFEEVLTNIIEDDDDDDDGDEDENENDMSGDIDEREKLSQPIENSDEINESEHTNEN